MGLINAASRVFRAFIRVISLGLIKIAEPIENNPQMIAMEYDEIISDASASLVRIKNAIGGLIAQRHIQLATLESKTDQLESLEEEKAGAKALMKERMQTLQRDGKSNEQILADPEFNGYQAEYNDRSSTIAELQGTINSLQQLIATIEQQVEDNLTQAKEANATISKLHIEKHDKTARMEIARSLEQIQALASPAGVNNYADKLSELRRRVAEADGRAEASARIAGTDTAARSAKLRQAARTKVQNSDLLRELGLISDKPPVSETPAAVADKPATLPEKD